MDSVNLSFISAFGMIIVALIPVIYWRRAVKLQYRWFWLGAALWTVAVALKVVSSLILNSPVIGFFNTHLPEMFSGAAGGLFIGIQSSFFEIGFTLAAVLIWKKLGSDSDRAIGIGIGAGSFEALLLGLGVLTGIIAYLSGVPGTEEIRSSFDSAADLSPLFFFIGPAERIMAILCHIASRVLVILGVTKKNGLMVFVGFLLFTLLDGIAGAAHIYGLVGNISMWWIELALLPYALASIPIIILCHRKWKS